MNNRSLKNRIQATHDVPDKSDGECVAYLMSRDQRVMYNHALYAAQLHAKDHGVPLVVTFMLYRISGTRSLEHVTFMLEGLENLAKTLRTYGIPLVVRFGANESMKILRQLQPLAVYTDMNPLKSRNHQLKQLSQQKIAPVYLVDTHNIVPVWITSSKQEYAARTIRPKIYRSLSEYLQPIFELTPQEYPRALLSNIPLFPPKDYISKLDYKKSGIKHTFKPGEVAARQMLGSFINSRLRGYGIRRNDPSVPGLSGLSPYLHFGHISSLEVVLQAQAAVQADASLQEDVDALIEEIVVRKELSDNYCYYNKYYNSLAGAPDWANTTLQKHASDPREHLYTKDQLEQAATHDDAWNAAQLELTKTGKMHGYMRMYWAKKVLEWSDSPEEAHRRVCYLNDFYSLDGGDPNGYVGILWSIAGLHDRPWQERAVYGKVRSMVYSGLQRKFDLQLYIDKINKKF